VFWISPIRAGSTGPEKGNLARQFCEPLVRWNTDYSFSGRLLDSWHVSADAIGAMLREAGFNLTRRVIPDSSFWNDWAKYPFSTTNWAARPLGVHVLALTYKSGAAWNESAHADPEFDAILEKALGVFDADGRRDYAAKLLSRLQDNGVIVQPFWRNQTKHFAKHVKNDQVHQVREMHFEADWLDT